MKSLKYILFIALAIFFVSCGDNIDEEIIVKDKKEDKKVINFNSKAFILETLDNKKISLETTFLGMNFKDFKNKIVLIDVFATWCEPCIKSIPHLNYLQKKYKDDLVIISVLFQDEKTKEELKAFAKEYGINYIITVSEENLNLAKELGNISKVPEYYLYDKKGTYVRKFVGETKKEVFEMSILNILKK